MLRHYVSRALRKILANMAVCTVACSVSFVLPVYYIAILNVLVFLSHENDKQNNSHHYHKYTVVNFITRISICKVNKYWKVTMELTINESVMKG